MPSQIACIVEGQGDVESVPLIVRRIAEAEGVHDLVVKRPFRVGRYAIVRPGELERAIERAARSLPQGTPGGLLVLLDADDDLPCTLGPDLKRRATSARSDKRPQVVLANREKEAWYLAAIESLRGQRAIPNDQEPPAEPESIRGAKGWLARVMRRPYSEIADQAAFGSTFDLALARRRSASFDRFYRAVATLIAP